MSQLKVNNIIPTEGHSQVLVEGFLIGPYEEIIDYSKNNPDIENGAVLYDDLQEKFFFKQDDEWLTLGGSCCTLDEVLSAGNETEQSLIIGGLTVNGNISANSISVSSVTSESITSTVSGYEFPDGTVQITAWVPNDCNDCDIGDLNNVNTDIVFPTGTVILKYDEISEHWYPGGITTSDLGDICPCDEYEIGDILIWSGTCWNPEQIPGLTPCTFNLEADGGDTLLLECGDTIKIIGGSAAINTWTSTGAGGEDQVEIAWEAGLNMLGYGDGTGGESGNVNSSLAAEIGDILQWDATINNGQWDAIGAPGGVLNVGDVLAWDGDHWIGASPTGSVGLENIAEDLTPQLGADLDVNGNDIVSVGNGDIVITPSGTGHVILSQLIYPNSDGTAGQYITTNGSEVLSWADLPAGGGGGADNLGNHIATENLQMNDFWLSNDGTDHGIYIKSDGNVGINTNDAKQAIDIENKGGFHVNQFESQGNPPPWNATAWVAAVSAGDFRSYKVFLTVVDKTLDNLGNPLNEYMSTTIVVIHDGTNVYHSEYGRIEINPNSVDPLNDPLTNGFTFQSTMNQPGVLDEVTLTIEIGPNGNIFEGTAIITALQGDL